MVMVSSIQNLNMIQKVKQESKQERNDYNTGTQVNIANFSDIYPLLYFDLTYQTAELSRDPKQLNIRFRLSQAAAADFRVHAIVLYEEDVVVDKVGDQLVIV